MGVGVKFSDIVPYTSVFIDCKFGDIVYGLEQSVNSDNGCLADRQELLQDLHHLFVTESNPSPALVCLSARTAFDLYLRTMEFPSGSEIIFSAINIPDMAFIAREHRLRVVPCDLDLETMGPRLDLLQRLITCKTVALLIAHVFGRWCDLDPVIEIAQRSGLKVIEDCAEAFCGFENLGNPCADLTLFSFGPIKYYTALGGGVAKVRDRGVWSRMMELHDCYPIQSKEMFLQKLLKCAGIFLVLNVPQIIKPGVYLTRKLNFDHKKKVVDMLRGFPENLMFRLRHRPPIALLHLLRRRLLSFDKEQFSRSAENGEHIWNRLPDKVLRFGSRVTVNNFWLFPILVKNPGKVSLELNRLGVDAYIGATQLNSVEPESASVSRRDLQSSTQPTDEKVFLTPEPKTAKFFMTHVVYLPVNKTVPSSELEKISMAVEKVCGAFCDGLPVPPTPDDAFIARI